MKSFIGKALWKYKYRYLLGLFTLLCVDFFNLYIPQTTGEIVDGLTSHVLTFGDVKGLIIRIAILTGIIALGRVAYRYFIILSARKIEYEVRDDIFKHLETLSSSYFNENKTGDLMAYFTNDLEALQMSIGWSIISAFDATILTAMCLYKMMFQVNINLTLLTLIPMSIIGIGSYFMMNEFETRYTRKQDAFSAVSDMVQESISAERVIKAFVEEKNQEIAFDKVNNKNRSENMHLYSLYCKVFPLLDLVIQASYAITIIYGGYLAIIGKISLGQFIAFNQYLGTLIWPMIALGDALTALSQGKASVGRINKIFNEVPEIKDENVKDVTSLSGDIAIDHLSFKYKDNLPYALKDINVHIHKNETLAILGRTGDGKSTLVSLLLHLYNAKEGSIKFDGYDINEIPLKTLRESIAYVPQDSYLFSDTIASNIKFGNGEANMDDIVEVCQEACIHDNIMDFPDKYETIVGERGVTLSGGQKQRCAIARALIKKSAILIFDDSLSAVDTDTEDKILQHLRTYQDTRTIIMIAHRLSTMKNADHILVLNDGCMAQYGTFDELLNEEGIFKDMYEKQQLEKQLNEEM